MSKKETKEVKPSFSDRLEEMASELEVLDSTSGIEKAVLHKVREALSVARDGGL